MIIFQIIVLVFSAVIHEVCHGAMADRLGDPTARLAGRLTLNPLKHLDPFGSVLLPLMLALIPGGVVFGWAKPVPFNPYHLKHPDRDGALIAFAGPASNILIAIIFSIFYRLIGSSVLGELFVVIVIINVSLAVFNMVPIPPLDGSKILFAFLPNRLAHLREQMERYGMMILVAFIFFGVHIISPIIYGILRVLLG